MRVPLIFFRQRAVGLFALLVGVLIILVGHAPAAYPWVAEDAQEQTRAEKLVVQLDDADPDVRRAAALQLNSLGSGALEVIEKAAGRDDLSPELKRRLDAAVKIIRPRAVVQRRQRKQYEWESSYFQEACGTESGLNGDRLKRARLVIEHYFALRMEPWKATDKPRLALFKDVEQYLDDPIIRFIYVAIAPRVAGSRPGDFVPEGQSGALAKIINGPYKSPVKIVATTIILKALNAGMDPNLQKMDKWFADTAAMKDVPPGEPGSLLDRLYEAHDRIQWEQCLKILEQNDPKSPAPFIERARALLNDYSQGRQLEMATGTFTEEKSKKFDEETARAITLLKQAWELDHDSDQAARLTLMGLHLRGEKREEVEKWYRRATDAAPDSLEACQLKMDYMVYWSANSDELIAFGRELLATENWRAGIPFMLVDAHERAANATTDRAAYFQNPKVWNDIHDVYDGMLINFPEAFNRRCQYAKYSGLCGHWDIADKQCRIIGDHPAEFGVFGSQASYDYFRKKAARLAKAGTDAAGAK